MWSQWSKGQEKKNAQCNPKYKQLDYKTNVFQDLSAVIDDEYASASIQAQMVLLVD